MDVSWEFPRGDRGFFSRAGGRYGSAVGSVDSSDFLGDVRRVGDDGYWAGFDGGVSEAVGSARRLTYPLAQVPLDLTEGFDGKRGWPPFMRNWLFWVGFAVAALPLLWNLIEYWTPGFPRLAIFDPYYGPRGPRGASLSRYLQPFSYRLLPPVLGFTFLCDLNILFSIWSLWLVGQVGLYGMSRVGFSIGLAGQEAKPTAILGLFTHGVSMGLAIWAIWVARGHLRKVFRQVVRPPVNGEAEPRLCLPD